MLPAPTNVSIVSFNLEHTLTWLPGPGTPDNTHFTVQSLRKNSWQLVKGCARLKTSQSCDLTNTFKDSFYHYKARVQAITTTQKSNWSLSMPFNPLTDTLLGPPVVSVSGCGNCLLLQVTPPTSRGLQHSLSPTQLLYRQFTCKVRRTRDGSQFSMWVTSTEKTVIGYLEPGAEYCVTVTASTSFNPHSVPSEPHCAFTSPTAANTGTVPGPNSTAKRPHSVVQHSNTALVNQSYTTGTAIILHQCLHLLAIIVRNPWCLSVPQCLWF
uniref:Fibronectin type-III domain-containing protein n=1 Tax=Salmo trutta TaxID=8032 RepID=A0A673XWC3_SALTR